jgi:hypothetical protein
VSTDSPIKKAGLLVTWVAIGKTLSEEEVRSLLNEMLPGQRVFATAELLADPTGSPWGEIADIQFDVDRHRGEFSTTINLVFYRFDNADYQRVNLFIAARLATRLECRTYCDGSGYGTDASPYWGLLFDRGICFLADDSHTDADGEGGPVRIVKPLELATPDRL